MNTKNLKITKDNIVEHLVNKMFEIIGVDNNYQNLIETKNETWFQDYTWNKDQEESFKIYTLPLIKKIYKLNKDVVNRNYYWFLLQYGLRRNDYE